jgi:hypothetical protein
MKQYQASSGSDRTGVSLSAFYQGNGLVVCIFNANAHIGAVAVADYDHKEERAFSSVVTLPGHRDDEVAKKQAHIIARHTKKPVCVIAGIHLDDINLEEIKALQDEVDRMVQAFLDEIAAGAQSPS